MGKYSKYKKKYNPDWEKEKEFMGWLCQCDDDEEMAYCIVCRAKLRPQKADLKKHAQTAHHIHRFKMHHAHKKITSFGVNKISTSVKLQEIKLALYVATHTSIRSVDHLSDIIVANGKGFHLENENIKLHRSKCSALIKNVIGPSILKETVEDINNHEYSLIVDESTDISVIKYLCVCVRYYSDTKKKVMTAFLSLLEVIEATANNLASLIIQFLNEIGLNIKNLIGLGTDGANNLCGTHHSVYTILKTHAPRLTLIKCIAHSLHLCLNHAAEELPSQLDFLTRETYSWFSRSSLRKHLYKKTFDLININTDNKLHQFVRLSDTRWLARAQAVKVILNQWLELNTHFNIIQEKCYTAKTLKEMYNDEQNYLYFAFLSPILCHVNSVNLLFQSENADILKLYTELYQLLLFTVKLFIKPVFLVDVEEICEKNFKIISKTLENQLALLDVVNIDAGIVFLEHCNTKKISKDIVFNVKLRCRNFLLELSKQLLQRIPCNLNLIRLASYISPEKCLSLYNRPKFMDLPLELLKENMDKSVIECQWKNLVNIKWSELIGKETYSSEEFWSFVYNYQNAGQQFIFREIAEFALTILSLPLSNATVERVFSIMNAIKTKARNRLNIKMLESLLHIKCFCIFNKTCCTKFEVTPNMLQKFNSNMYLNNGNIVSGGETLELDTIDLFNDVVNVLI